MKKHGARTALARSAFTGPRPRSLETVGPEVEIPEGSIARISMDRTAEGDLVYVVGDHTIYGLPLRGRTRTQTLDDWTGALLGRPRNAEQSYRLGSRHRRRGKRAYSTTATHVYDGRPLAAAVASAVTLHLLARLTRRPGRLGALRAPSKYRHGKVANPRPFDPCAGSPSPTNSRETRRIEAFRLRGARTLFTRLCGARLGAATNNFRLYPDTWRARRQRLPGRRRRAGGVGLAWRNRRREGPGSRREATVTVSVASRRRG